MARAFTLFCTAALLALSGCASGGSDSDVGGPGAPRFDDDHGSISGVVTDDNLLPIVGALVTVNDGIETILSNADGQFAFSLLTPDLYTVRAVADGFAPAETKVDVVEGTVSKADLQLVALASDATFHVTAIVEGNLGCSVAVYVAPADRWQPANLCGIPGFEDKYLVASPMSGSDVSQLFTVVFETEWTSTQLTGSGLNIRTSFESDAGEDVFGSPFWDMRGQSPLKMEINRTVIEELGAADPSFFANCSPNGTCHFEMAAYPWPGTLGSSSPIDVGANVEQRFTHHVTEFYGEPADAEFSAIPDA